MIDKQMSNLVDVLNIPEPQFSMWKRILHISLKSCVNSNVQTCGVIVSLTDFDV